MFFKKTACQLQEKCYIEFWIKMSLHLLTFHILKLPAMWEITLM